MAKTIIGTWKRTLLAALALAGTVATADGQTLDECLAWACDNYPLTRKTALIQQTTGLSIDNIDKGWLPQVQASVQATYQSDVAALPESLRAMMSQMGGTDYKGLSKAQYRVGVEVSQMVYDGGSIESQKQVAQLQGAISQSQNAVDLYAVRQRVCDLYFGVLLIDSKLSHNANRQAVLAANERTLGAMLKAGTASESDFNTVKAERLAAVQEATELSHQRKSLVRLLAAFTGKEVKDFSKPELPAAGTENKRPELTLFDRQTALLNAEEKSLDSYLKPKVYAFAQGYYGYPGYNMFHDMMERTPTLNGMIGVKVAWSIGALYSRKNDKRKLALQRDMVENQRDVFLFNNSLQQTQTRDNMSRYRALMEEDDEIIRLHAAVRRAAESKLSHGIIDSNDLVAEINKESNAQLMKSLHELQMLQEAYNLKVIEGED